MVAQATVAQRSSEVDYSFLESLEDIWFLQDLMGLHSAHA